MLISNALRQGDRLLALSLIQHAYPYQLNQRDVTGQTPLHLAVQKHDLVIIDALLTKGAQLNLLAQDPCYKDMTALHYAALTGDWSAANLLLQWGANTQILNGQRLSPASIAYQHGFTKVAQLIERYTSGPTKSQSTKLCLQKVLELRNSGVEALETRKWLNDKIPEMNNVVSLAEFRKRRH